MRGGKPRYIFWDLDETLGRFRPPDDKSGDGKRGLMHGIRELLEERLDSGCRNVVTTAAETAYAESSLQEFGIRRYFDAIFDRSSLCDERFNKHYLRAAVSMGVPPGEAPDRILVIGNLAKDAPADSDIVFLYHPNAVHYDADVISRILSYMESFGSWRAAQEALAGADNPRVLSNITESYDGEKLLIGLEGIYSLLGGCIGLMGCRCSISAVPDGSDSPFFEREVRRVVYPDNIDPAFSAPLQEAGVFPRLALAVNE